MHTQLYTRTHSLADTDIHSCYILRDNHIITVLNQSLPRAQRHTPRHIQGVKRWDGGNPWNINTQSNYLTPPTWVWTNNYTIHNIDGNKEAVFVVSRSCGQLAALWMRGTVPAHPLYMCHSHSGCMTTFQDWFVDPLMTESIVYESVLNWERQ